MLEDSMRELQKDVQRQLSERQANDTQLSILEFNLFSRWVFRMTSDDQLEALKFEWRHD